MGQIVGGAAKPKRCNLSKLSQLGTPAAGEHILVSSDNSMNAAGQGNFDAYVVGNGSTAATALELKHINPELYKTIETTYTSENGNFGSFDGYIKITLNPPDKVRASGFKVMSVPISKPCRIVTNTSVSGTSTAGHIVVNSSNAYVATIVPTNGVFQITQALIDAGAVAAKISFSLSSTPFDTIYATLQESYLILDDIGKLNDDVNELLGEVYQEEVTNYNDNSEGVEDGYYRVDTTPPSLVRQSNFRALAIPIKEGDVVTTNSMVTGTDTAGFVLIDENNACIEKIVPNNQTFVITEEMVLNGAAYIGLSWNLSNTPNITATKTSTINLSDRVAALEEEIGGGSTQATGIPVNNAYKGVAPSAFREKLLNMTDDVNILLLGDSMTAFTNSGTELPNAANLPAGCQRNAITYQLWNLLCKNKPQCDRFDSEVNTFTESGTWALSDVTKQNNSVNSGAEKGEFSADNCVYHEASETGASVAFQWDLDSYEKLNFIYRVSAYDGTTGVTISCTSGKVLVYDRANSAWVEANGFVFSQTKTAGYKPDYEADWVRNVPLKMKRVDGATGSVTLTFTNTGSGTMYYWGTERYNWNIVRVTNIARGGRHIQLLQGSIKSEIEYRDVDLIVLQLPLWNELKQGGNFNGAWDARHIGFLDYLKSQSNNFADFQVIVNVYHTQVYDWDGNKNLQFQANGVATNPKTDLPSWQCEMKTILSLDDYDANVPVCNLVNELYDYAQSIGKTMQEILSTTEFTVDGTHCSEKGFAFYSGLIAPMMYE